ncbi:MAG TPA: outer membrane protein assembly factor BamD [bacterium]|nr:outer membrane protein assembly factor BamD [bacterium]
MMRLRRLMFLLLALAATGCPKRAQLPPIPQDAQQAIDQAVGDMEAKRYSKAEDQFTFIIFNFAGSRQASDAQYYLAESYFRSKDYVDAQNEFDFYLKSFPNSRFQEDATYKLAVSYLRSAPGPIRDQTRTLKARETIDQFLETFPDSPLRGQVEQLRGEIGERLALREFDAARIYYTSGEYKSALVYYNHVNDSFPAQRWPGVEKYRFANCLLETGDTTKARAMLSELVTGECEPAVKKLARAILGRTS